MNYICEECNKIIGTGAWDYAITKDMHIYHTSCWKKKEDNWRASNEEDNL